MHEFYETNNGEAKMPSINLARRPLLFGPLAIAFARDARAQSEMAFLRVPDPDGVAWKANPLGAFLQSAVIDGDPTKPGLYVIRNKFAPGYLTRPHTHPFDRHIVVLSGTWLTGTGETFDPKSCVPLGPGSYMKHPAGALHYDGAGREACIIQVAGMGPITTEYLRPQEGGFGRYE